MRIRERVLGEGHPTFIIAELSANHNRDFDQAVALVHAAKEAGANAVKLQTYIAAAKGAPPDQALELNRLAGENLLSSGHLEAGLELFRDEVFARLGMRGGLTSRPIPDTPLARGTSGSAWPGRPRESSPRPPPPRGR